MRRFRRSHRGGRSSRRKFQWSESNLGAVSTIPDNALFTGWAVFPGGQTNFAFATPSFQPQDFTLTRTLWNPALRMANTTSDTGNSAGSTWTFAIGLIAWDAQDGNVYQNAIISDAGIGSVPHPAANTDADWLLKVHFINAFAATDGVAAFGGDSLDRIWLESRAQRKLSANTGILIIAGWAYDDPRLADTGNTLAVRFNVKVRNLLKAP